MCRSITILLLFISFVSFNAGAQILTPVKWSFTAVPINDQEVDIILKANIDKGWYVYSQYIDEGGPNPSNVTFEKTAAYSLQGKNKEGGHMKKVFDDMFEMNLIKFSEIYTITQRLKVKDWNKPVKGSVYFQ